MKGVIASTPGDVSVLQLVDVPRPVPGPDEVLVKIHASAINRADTSQRTGNYAPPPGATHILGLEFAGEVAEACGEWKLGARVMSIVPGGGNAEYVTVHKDQLMAIPESLSYHESAAIPEVWLTAYQIIRHIGMLQPGETVLIHAGGSGVGTALVQLATRIGARAIVTAGTQEKIDACLLLGAVGGINYKEVPGFSDTVRELTDGRGVDLVLDCVGASYFEENLASIALDGRWVLYGTMGGAEVERMSLRGFMGKRIQFTATTLRTRSIPYKIALVRAFVEFGGLDAFSSGEFKPIIDTAFALEDIQQAHARMGDNANIGKIILTVLP